MMISMKYDIDHLPFKTKAKLLGDFILNSVHPARSSDLKLKDFYKGRPFEITQKEFYLFSVGIVPKTDDRYWNIASDIQGYIFNFFCAHDIANGEGFREMMNIPKLPVSL